MANLRKAAGSILRDLTALAGVGCLTYGAWQVYEPAGWLVGGASLVLLAVAATLARPR